MSLTSYRAAPPRVIRVSGSGGPVVFCLPVLGLGLRSGGGSAPRVVALKHEGRVCAALGIGLGRVRVEKMIFSVRRYLVLRLCLEGERRCFFLRFADLAATYSPAS